MSSSSTSTTTTSSPTNPEATIPEATSPEVAGYHHHHWSSSYLNVLPPTTWDILQKGLALFAVLVILRSCLARLSACFPSLTRRRRRRHLTSSTSPTPRRVSFVKEDPIALSDAQDFASPPPPPPPSGDPDRTTIHHFRPYLHQRYPPGSLPPWAKEPPKFRMDQGRLLGHPLDVGDDDGPVSSSAASIAAGAAAAAAVTDMPGNGPDAPPQAWKSVSIGGGTGPLRHHLLARPPPAPPLTPPELSHHPIFTLGGGGRPSAHAHDSFIHQPNPDYTSGSPSSEPSSGGVSMSPQTRRFSYSRTIPIGVPVPRKPSASTSGDDAHDSDLAFSPSSYPPTSPLLPPAPPVIPTSSAGLGGVDHDGGRREIDLQGQVVSVLDQDGAGWKRHTRVYGGGVCLACKAAGQEHGAGGFYGATVSPEEMR